jgi:hypothetical protein
MSARATIGVEESEAPGHAIQRDRRLLGDVRAYVGNCVEWLAPEAV